MTQADAIKPIRALARPKALAIASIAGLVTVGWLYLAVTLAGVSGGTSILEVLCRPMFGTSAFGMAQAMLVFAMWCAMALAMMLPTAAPILAAVGCPILDRSFVASRVEAHAPAAFVVWRFDNVVDALARQHQAEIHRLAFRTDADRSGRTFHGW